MKRSVVKKRNTTIGWLDTDKLSVAILVLRPNPSFLLKNRLRQDVILLDLKELTSPRKSVYQAFLKGNNKKGELIILRVEAKKGSAARDNRASLLLHFPLTPFNVSAHLTIMAWSPNVFIAIFSLKMSLKIDSYLHSLVHSLTDSFIH